MQQTTLRAGKERGIKMLFKFLFIVVLIVVISVIFNDVYKRKMIERLQNDKVLGLSIHSDDEEVTITIATKNGLMEAVVNRTEFIDKVEKALFEEKEDN